MILELSIMLTNFKISVINVDVGMLTKFSTSASIERIINDKKIIDSEHSGSFGRRTVRNMQNRLSDFFHRFEECIIFFSCIGLPGL